MEVAQAIIRGVLYGVALLPPVIAAGWMLVEAYLRPCLIARSEVERLADALSARCPDDPEHAAFLEEHAAWLRSETFEQGKWRRVRRLIRQRLA